MDTNTSISIIIDCYIADLFSDQITKLRLVGLVSWLFIVLANRSHTTLKENIMSLKWEFEMLANITKVIRLNCFDQKVCVRQVSASIRIQLQERKSPPTNSNQIWTIIPYLDYWFSSRAMQDISHFTCHVWSLNLDWEQNKEHYFKMLTDLKQLL